MSIQSSSFVYTLPPIIMVQCFQWVYLQYDQIPFIEGDFLPRCRATSATAHVSTTSAYQHVEPSHGPGS